MSLATAIVDGHALLQLVYVSLLAGVGVCVVYALAVVGITRAQEARRASLHRRAALYALGAAVALAACGWATATGISIMTSK